MKRLNTSLLAAGLALALGSLTHPALADSPADFVDEASAKGIAEIETSKMALDKGSSPAVKRFAEQMIEDHTQANQELTEIARQKELDVADEAELMNKAKAMILQLRSGENFDQAYANNQVVAHEQSVELFREQIAEGEDAEVKAFATRTLPKLEHHLEMARELASTHQKSE